MEEQTRARPDDDLSNRRLIRRLLGLAWEYKAGCIRILMVQLCLLVLGLSGLGLTGLAIDVIHHAVDPQVDPPNWPFGLALPAQSSTMDQVMAIAGAILVFAAARSVLNYSSGLMIARLVHTRIVYNLRSQVYEKLQRLSFRFFGENTSGTIISRVTGDVQAVRTFIDGVVIQTVIMAISLLVYVAYMASISPLLTLACLGSTPLLWWISIVFSRKVRPAYVENRRLRDGLVLKFSETIRGIFAVKGFGKEADEFERFARKNAEAKRHHGKIFWMVSLYSPTVGFITKVNLFILLLFGGKLVMDGELGLGSGIVVFAALLQQFSSQVGNLAGIANSVQLSLTGARRVFEVLDAPVEVQSKPGARRVDRLKGRVCFNSVGFEYSPTSPVLEDITFTVEPGERVAIVGATGSGKTALLSLVARFYDPVRGEVAIDGIDLRDLEISDLRRNVGIVFQESFLFSNTVAANIAFGRPEATREQIERAAKIACAHDFITEMPHGYDTVLGETGKTLSGGQRQRLAIARAVLLEPGVLLLDDPTASIDPGTEREILEAIENATQGRTTFIVANRLSSVRRADRIVVMHRGRVAQIGRFEELMDRPGIFRTLARLQLVDDLAERSELLDSMSKERYG